MNRTIIAWVLIFVLFCGGIYIAFDTTGKKFQSNSTETTAAMTTTTFFLTTLTFTSDISDSTSIETTSSMESIEDELIDQDEWFVTDTFPTTEIEPNTSFPSVENEADWASRAEKYPIATEIWLYMKENFGWNDELCAGVMGNIMAEIAGGTLDFSRWESYSQDRSYGLFQWLGSRKANLKENYGENPSIEKQLEFMYDELHGTDGVKPEVTESQREKILKATTPEDAAFYFCEYFERPGEGHSNIRKKYAREAYAFFAE